MHIHTGRCFTIPVRIQHDDTFLFVLIKLPMDKADSIHPAIYLSVFRGFLSALFTASALFVPITHHILHDVVFSSILLYKRDGTETAILLVMQTVLLKVFTFGEKLRRLISKYIKAVCLCKRAEQRDHCTKSRVIYFFIISYSDMINGNFFFFINHSMLLLQTEYFSDTPFLQSFFTAEFSRVDAFNDNTLPTIFLEQ